MIRFISASSSKIYHRIAKPIFFRQKPDTVHARLVRTGVFLQKFPFALRLLSGMWSYNNELRLKQTVNDIPFVNPVGLAAGFDKNIELLPLIRSVGFGFMTGGSVTYKPCAGNPRPWFYRLPKTKSLIVHVGLANQGAERVRQRIRSYQEKWYGGFPLVVSVAKTNNPENSNDTEAIADYVGSLQLLQNEAFVSVHEINISCPNTYGGEPFTTPKRLEALLQAVDGLALTKPVWIKMPINLDWRDFSGLLHVISRHTVAAVTIGNLSKNRSATVVSDTIPKGVKGNLSGMPTQRLSDDLIAKTYRKYGHKLTIIGVGGIFSAEDAYRKICLGASLVELVTGMIFEGPQLIGQINKELVRLLEKDGFTNISEAIGSKNK